MKYLLCAVVALIGLLAPAAAADLGGSYKDSDSGYTTGVFNWTGVTAGLALGAGLASFANDGADIAGIGVSRESLVEEAFVTAAWQFPHSQLVVGATGAVSYSEVFKTVSYGLDAEAGVALGNVQPFALVGVNDINGDTALEYGGGVKFAISQHLIADLTVKRSAPHVSKDGVSVDATSDQITAGLGWKFP